MPDLLTNSALAFALIGLLYYWAWRNRRQGWRRRPRTEVFYQEMPAAQLPPVPAPDVVSLAPSLLALNRALETSVAPEPAPEPDMVRSKPL